MSGGNTSKATNHLMEMHSMDSKKTTAEGDRKRTRENELELLKRSPLFRNDPGRAYVLLETRRIVNNNLPFRLGEYEETLLIRDLMLKEHAQVALNAKVIRHAVVELYDATKRQVQAMLQNNTIGSAKCFSIVADFWAASAKNTKFLGLRLYLVDSNFCFKSVLLGTRHFAPMFGERDGGIRGPFYRWIGDILQDFGLTRHDLYGATSDGGPDTVYQTQHVEVMGTLFSELCAMMHNAEEDGSTVNQLLNFRTHRFLGLTRVVYRILLLWDPLVDWYQERADRARRENVVPPAVFPLKRDKMDLLSNLATTTRALLGKAFQRAFFRRYTDRASMNKCSYAFEMQLMLHPNFKNPDGALKKVVLMCNLQLGASQKVAERHYIKVRRYVMDGIRKLMAAVDSTPCDAQVVAPPPAAVFSEDLMELFAEVADEVAPPPAETRTVMTHLRMDEEFDRWITTPTSLRAVREGQFESVLSYWRRQSEEGTFRLLPLVARVVFSMPASSAQIERDFGVAGQMVVPHRSSLAPYNIDMATFLNCNRAYCDLTQCPKLSVETASEQIPSNMMVSMERDLNDEFGSLNDLFSNTSIELGLEDEDEDDGDQTLLFDE
ncbi:hypothetical protein BBJ28_00016774 [Nothophytophthora sp. Chile5]|nr:hypothetical protein BBJ28_00016774 [Nothophytophthora sp. Chile5]